MGSTEGRRPVVRELADSGALIVGGTAGIGLYSALALAQAGVRDLVLVGRSAERGESVRQLFGERGFAPPVFVQGDVLAEGAAERIVADAAEHLPGLDILMCSTAADVRPELFGNIPTSDVARTLTSLALPSLLVASSALPLMRARGGGVIINVASDAGKTATPGEAVIGAAKAAIIMFTRTVAIEEKRNGIRANVLTPSLVEGTASTERITSDGFSAKLFAKAAQQASLGVPHAEDVGALAAFIASPAAAKLTGQAISVNGGISAA